jgi:hypothetical protein
VSLVAHGTESGYKSHMRHGTPPCRECKDYRAERQRTRRARKPVSLDREKAYSRARSRAFTRLADECRARFVELLNEELAREKGAA